MNLARLFHAASRRMPEGPAITDGAVTLSYGELSSRAAGIAGGLVMRGLRPGDRVGLWMENCGAFFECIFACWSAGLVIVPINARLHPAEVAHILDDCGARLLFTTPELHAGAQQVAAATLDNIVCAPSAAYERLASSRPGVPHQGEASDLAWLFYTSGTTGRPKGAMLSHRNLLGMVMAYYADVDAVTPGSVHLHSGAVSHACGMYALPFFLHGGHNVVLPGFDLSRIAESLRRWRDVTMFAAPTMMTRLVGVARGGGLDITNLRTLYYGGGPTYLADLERAIDCFGDRLFHLYGQGESPMTITGLCGAAHLTADPSVLNSCGTARTGVELRIADEVGHELPPGEAGEVLTRSEIIMQGYWNLPEATTGALVDGWLRTGDVGSLDERGYLTLRDRSKDMIISGGMNIYPREIEEVLLREPTLLEVSVVGRPHPEWGEEVVAFVVPRPGEQVNLEVLDRLCLDRIARFKRPRHYRVLDALPKNNYGKVLKTDLRRRLAEQVS